MRACTVCGKGYRRVFSRSHSLQATIRKLQPNLQWMKLGSRRVKACTQCIKTQNKSKLASPVLS